MQGALQWLEDNQDKPIEDLRASASAGEHDETDPTVDPPALKEGEVARSLVCDDCGKRFRSTAQAEFHSTKTYVMFVQRFSVRLLIVITCSEHQNFSESTEEIAPLTEEEKKQKLEELRQKAKERKAKQAIIDKEEAKKNEVPILLEIWPTNLILTNITENQNEIH